MPRRSRMQSRAARGQENTDKSATIRFPLCVPLHDVQIKCAAPMMLPAVDAGGDTGGAEAVVDIHDGDVRSAGIEHAEECGDSAEAGAVAHAGRDRDDRRGHRPPTTLGKAPSMPATQMTTRASTSMLRCSSSR